MVEIFAITYRLICMGIKYAIEFDQCLFVFPPLKRFTRIYVVHCR
jgi:hypothetical protein